MFICAERIVLFLAFFFSSFCNCVVSNGFKLFVHDGSEKPDGDHYRIDYCIGFFAVDSLEIKIKFGYLKRTKALYL